MKKVLMILLALLTACSGRQEKKADTITSGFITDEYCKAAADSVKKSRKITNEELLLKGIKHAASLWRQEDGTPTTIHHLRQWRLYFRS